jgi:hypothetical protein
MAVTDVNTGGQNVLVCTAAADSYTAPNDRRIHITGVRWVGTAVAATDHLVIQNGSSQTVFEDYAMAAAGATYSRESKVFRDCTYWSTFSVPTMSSGTLYVYYD